MKFLIILICLLIERFVSLGKWRSFTWFDRGKQLLARYFPNRPDLIPIVIIMLPVIVIAMFSQVLRHQGFVLIYLLFSIALICYCLGPANLWRELKQGSKLEPAIENKEAQPTSNYCQPTWPITAEQGIFTVLFWFVVIGPAAAFLYRLLRQHAQEGPIVPSDEGNMTTGDGNTTAQSLVALLDWLPTRLFIFGYALAGEFKQVFAILQKNLNVGLSATYDMLKESGLAALGLTTPLERINPRLVIELLDRTFIIWLIILGLVYMSH